MIQTQNGVFALFRSAQSFVPKVEDTMAGLAASPTTVNFQKNFKDLIEESEAHKPTDGAVRCYGMLFTSKLGQFENQSDQANSVGLMFYADLKLEEMEDFGIQIPTEVPREEAIDDMVKWFNSNDFRQRTAFYWEKLFRKFEFFGAFYYERLREGDVYNFSIVSYERVFSQMTADAIVRDLHLMDTFVCDMMGAPPNWQGRDSRRADWPGTGREPNYSWQMRRPMRYYGDDAIQAGIRGMAEGVMGHMARDGARPARDYMEGLPSQGYRTYGMSDRDQVNFAMIYGHDLQAQAGRFAIADVAPFMWKFLRDRMEEVGALSAEQFRDIDDVMAYGERRHMGPYVTLIMDQKLLDADEPHGCLQLKVFYRASASLPAGLIAHIAVYKALSK